MAYTRPMVMVFQEYESTSISTPSAELPPCIVGPCYHIVDPVEDEIMALYADGYTLVGIDSGFYPNNAPGALIQKESTTFRFKNAMVRIVDNSSLAQDKTTAGNTLYVDGWDTVVSLVGVGDYVTFIDTTDAETPVEQPVALRVIGTNEATGAIMLNRTCPLTDANTTRVTIERKIDEFVLPWDDPHVFLDVTSERFTLSGVVYGVDDAEFPVSSAELYVGYKALRQDLSDIKTLYSVDEITGQLGKISSDNPLALATSIAMANAGVGIKVIGVDSEDLAGYTAAKDRLEHHDPLYAIVPLTMDQAVLAMFKAHAEEYSQPEVGKWRMAIGCTRLVTEKELARGLGMLSRDGDGDFVILTTRDTEITFMSSSVDAGDTLTLIADDVEYKYVISSVVSEDTLTVTQSAPFDSSVFSPDVNYDFYVTHRLDKLDQAKEIANTSRAYNYCRYVNIFPDVCVIDGKEEPGYYLGAALAAGIGGLPSHYGMTRLSVSGIQAVKHAGDYFNQDQLDTIADGGTLIFVQTSETAPPYIRHQLTTDRSTLEFQELSFVKNFDYLSYICRDTMDVFLGKYNITVDTLNTLRGALTAVLETQMLDSRPKIGSRVLDYNITKVEQLENVRDRVEMYAEVSMPYPLNTIGLHLKSVFLQVTSSAN